MSEKITFKELVEQISKQSRQSQNSTTSFIHELVGIIESGLRSKGSVSISGFGKFELRWMKERRGRNPQTGDEITIPGQNKVVFKPYKALREDVNRPYAKMKAHILGEAPSVQVKPPEQEKTKENGPGTDSPGVEEDPYLIERDRPVPAPPAAEKTSAPPIAPPQSLPVPAQLETAPEIQTESEFPDIAEVQKSSRMTWAYAASTIVVALAVLAIIYLMQQAAEPAEITLNTPSREQIETVQENPQTPQAAIIETLSPEDKTRENTTVENYIVQPGETLWSIAESKLGDPYLWPWIYHLNKDTLDNPNELLKSTELTLPSQSTPEDLTPDQKDQIASGYLSVYNWSQEHQPDDAKFFLWVVGEFSEDVLNQASRQVDSGDLAFAINR